MFTTIVVGTDDTPTARDAVRTAGEIALACGAECVHVVNGYRPISEHQLVTVGGDLPEEFRMGLSSDQPGLTAVHAAELELAELGVEAVTHPIAAGGAGAILDVAEEVGADLIVVGGCVHGTSHRLLHKSVSEKIVHHAPCSVLIVHGG